MEVNDIPHEVMSGREANQRYPDQLKLPDDYKCVYEGSGGIILAAKALAAFQVLYVQSHVLLHACMYVCTIACCFDFLHTL